VAHVPFHELGAVDTIVDIVGAAIGLDHLGVERVHASAVATGMGMMKTEHGLLPIPGPAVVELLKGVPIYSRGITSELVTPTGAAILAATATSFGELPAMQVERVGYGAGTRELEIPNVLRLMVGRSAEEETAFGPAPAVVLEANIDDMNPEFYECVAERLFAQGALDVTLTPLYMKKNRPANTLTVLAPLAAVATLSHLILQETSTFGVRVHEVWRHKLERFHRQVDTRYGIIPVKCGVLDGRIVQAAPEYEACKRLALEQGVPVRLVYAEAASLAAPWLT
jgi:uncharacterized protein (TIGR00299 family) protein